MRGAQRLAIVFFAVLAVGAAGIGFCQQAAPAQKQLTAERANDLKELQQTVAEQQRAVDRVTARVDAVQGTSEAAGRASEAAARAASLVLAFVGLLGTAATVFVSVLALLGHRDIRQVTQRLTLDINAVRDEAQRHLDEARQCEQRAQAVAATLEQAAETASEYVKRIDTFASAAEAKAREFQSIQMGAELPPETKQALEDVGRRLDLVEALGLPLDAQACLARGNAFYDRGDYQGALDCYNRAMKLKPDYATAHLNRGVALWRLGRHEDSLAALDRAIELKLDDADAHSNRGVALGELGRHEEALAAHDRAIELKPNLAEAHNNRGVALGSLGRYEESLAASDRAIELKPDFGDAYYNRACADARLGRRDDAVADLSKAITLDTKYREMAKTDEDFAGVRDDPKFRRLVGLDGEEGAGAG